MTTGEFNGTENIDGWKLIQQALNFLNSNVTKGGSGILVIGATGDEAKDAVSSAANVLGLPVTFVTGPDIATIDFSPFRILYVPSDEGETDGGITDADNELLIGRKQAIQQFVNGGGGLMIAHAD